MKKLEKIMLTSAAIGTAISAGIATTTVINLLKMPEGTFMKEEIAPMLTKCYLPMVIGMIPAVYSVIQDWLYDLGKSRK